MRVAGTWRPRPGTMREAAYRTLYERGGTLTSAEFSAALGIAPDRLNTVVRDFVAAGVMVRTQVEGFRCRFVYTFGPEARLQCARAMVGRYPSVWSYAAGATV
jgi:hypothetical protein